MSSAQKLFPRYLFALLIAMSATLCISGCNDESPRVGSQYEVIKPLHVLVMYNDVKNKVVSKDTAIGYLHTELLAHRYFIAYQNAVTVGSVMTIAASAWRFPFFSKRFIVRLTPDPADGVDIVLELDGEFEGDLDGLNPMYFRLLKK